MLTVRQIAEQAGVRHSTACNWCREGMIEGAVRVDIVGANGKVKKEWRVPEDWKVKRMTKKDRSRAITEGMRIAREREKETAGNCPKWVPGRSDPASHVWRNSSAKSVRQLAEEMGVSCGMVTRFYDMALARYVG